MTHAVPNKSIAGVVKPVDTVELLSLYIKRAGPVPPVFVPRSDGAFFVALTGYFDNLELAAMAKLMTEVWSDE